MENWSPPNSHWKFGSFSTELLSWEKVVSEKQHEKTYHSKTFPPQNDYELKKTTNRLEKIGGSCLDCANLILFGFPSARGLMGCFRKSRGRSTVVGQVDWAQHPKQGTNKKMTIQTHLSFFRYSNELAYFVSSQIVKLCMFPTTNTKGWMLFQHFATQQATPAPPE